MASVSSDDNSPIHWHCQDLGSVVTDIRAHPSLKLTSASSAVPSYSSAASFIPMAPAHSIHCIELQQPPELALALLSMPPTASGERGCEDELQY